MVLKGNEDRFAVEALNFEMTKVTAELRIPCRYPIGQDCEMYSLPLAFQYSIVLLIAC